MRPRTLVIVGGTEGWYVRDLLRAAEASESGRWDARFIPLAQLAGALGNGRLVFSGGSIDLANVDCVLVRGMPIGSLEQIVFRIDILHGLEQIGIPVVNPPRALESAIDKYLSLQRLDRAGFRVPETEIVQDVASALDAFERLGGDVVVKPLFGSEGRGMLRIQDRELARRAFTTLSQLQHVLYLQRFIANPGYDLRVFVLGSQVLGMKRTCRGDWRANVAQGGFPEPFDISQEWSDYAISAAKCLGAEIAAVDVLPGLDGQNYLLEVNAVPGWKALATCHQRDIAQDVLRFLWQRTAERNGTAPSRP